MFITLTNCTLPMQQHMYWCMDWVYVARSVGLHEQEDKYILILEGPCKAETHKCLLSCRKKLPAKGKNRIFLSDFWWLESFIKVQSMRIESVHIL